MEVPHALVKDLRSTGYFFDELKKYSESPEMDLATYCQGFAIPYLGKVSEAFDKSSQPDRSRILKFAIGHLLETGDNNIVECIFGLKKVAVIEIDKTAKAAIQDQMERSLSHGNRKRMESAELLMKLLVNIIKMFKLVEPVKQRKAEEVEDPAGDAILQSWEIVVTGI